MKEWVLIRTLSGDLFVLKSYAIEAHDRLGHPYDKRVILAESDDREELVRFKHLTEED